MLGAPEAGYPNRASPPRGLHRLHASMRFFVMFARWYMVELGQEVEKVCGCVWTEYRLVSCSKIITSISI